MIGKIITKVCYEAKSFLAGKYLKMMLLFISLLIASVTMTVLLKSNLDSLYVPGYSDQPRPIRSMVFVKRTNSLNFVTCIDNEGLPSGGACTLFTDQSFIESATEMFNVQFAYSITGSAAVISHDISRNSSYIISAYHVCNDFNRRYISLQISSPAKHTLVFEYKPSVTLTDFYGNEFHAAEVRVSPENDACILGTTGIMKDIEPVRIAPREPEPGDRIYNIASPHGLSRPGAVLSYEGYYAGKVPANRTIKNPHYLFAIPTAPGSSGSIILNADGEVISVVSYGFITRSIGPIPPHDMWPNASGGPSLEAIIDLTAPRVIQ